MLVAEINPHWKMNDASDKDVVSILHLSQRCRHLQHSDVGPPTDGCAVVVCTYRRHKSLERFLISLADQTRRPDQILIVDASQDDATEQMITRQNGLEQLADCIHYFRVTGRHRGLTRQRNFGMSWCTADLVAFFDDDVVLDRDCLRVMEATFHSVDGRIVGVGAYEMGSYRQPNRLWRLRRFLGIIADLRPGSYQRSGISIPWEFLAPTNKVVPGDWLPGAAMMWKSSTVRELRFCVAFEGYAQAEDLDISLRARRRGMLVLAGAARIEHMRDEDGRPDHYRQGYMALFNRYQVHKRCLLNRNWRDTAWFVYAWSLDSFLLLRHFVYPSRLLPTLKHLIGRLHALSQLVMSKPT